MMERTSLKNTDFESCVELILTRHPRPKPMVQAALAVELSIGIFHWGGGVVPSKI